MRCLRIYAWVGPMLALYTSWYALYSSVLWLPLCCSGWLAVPVGARLAQRLEVWGCAEQSGGGNSKAKGRQRCEGVYSRGDLSTLVLKQEHSRRRREVWRYQDRCGGTCEAGKVCGFVC
ncbi:hypothetical protein GQ54DRAFT_213727 [Martensiomyces pterosporus]|nr:hypothetical protein GQ54DRAFT_213727 [Martensiomyces pterosporus]